MATNNYKPIEGFKNYSICDDGTIISHPITLTYPNGSVRITKEKKMSIWINKQGYYVVGLRSNGVYKKFLLHRLIAIAFISNPNNFDEINHINSDRSDYRLENLEWCTHKHNMTHAWTNQKRNKRIAKDWSYENNSNTKSVFRTKIDGTIDGSWPCIKRAASECSIGYSTIIKSLSNKKPVFGFLWHYTDN